MIIGLLGLGTIGSGIFEHLANRDDIRVKRIVELKRHPGLEHLETSDFNEVLNDPEIDTVVELIGGMEPAHTFTVQALSAGKNVVTANKLMFSHHMEEILALAREKGVQYRYDASVGGSIPFLYNLTRYRGADTITGIEGIVNGTTNLILDIMQSEGKGFDEVLKQAQAQGYAEANPAADIDGIDAQCKIAIASSVAYGRFVLPEGVDTFGIRHITGADIINFKGMDLVCRLIAASKLNADGTVSAWVEPTLVPTASAEAAVKLNNNIISVDGTYFGRHSFIGQGAGKDPTAFAVEMGLRDILDGVTDRMTPMPVGNARVDNARAAHCYYLRTAVQLDIPAKRVGENACVTEPMTVRTMHDLAKRLSKADEATFFAGIRE